jgi:K+-sensing histidine kinase KdpD
LNAMAGWLHLLAADTAARSEASNRAIAGARRAVEQQLGQIDRIGQLLRLSGGSIPPLDDRIELAELLDSEVRRQLEADGAGQRRIELRRCAASSERSGFWVIADRPLLEDALHTLVTFALRHGTPGAVLELELEVMPEDDVSLVMRIDEGQDAGLSVWHAFAQSGARLALDLYVAVLAIESCGGSVLPRAARTRGQELEIRLPVS